MFKDGSKLFALLDLWFRQYCRQKRREVCVGGGGAGGGRNDSIHRPGKGQTRQKKQTKQPNNPDLLQVH